MNLSSPSEPTISINDLRRNFGEIEKLLPFVSRFVVTKKGKPFALLSTTSAIKKKLMKKTAGAFKGTMLDKDAIWKEVGKKKSRKEMTTL